MFTSFKRRDCLLLASIAVTFGTRSGEAQHYHSAPHAQPYGDQNYHYHSYSQPFQYGGRTHLDELAADLKYAANRICWDMYENYRHNPGYVEDYRAAYKMLQDAKHIYMLVWEQQYHQHAPTGGVDHIASDLSDIDGLFHQIETNVGGWTPYKQNRYHDQGMLPAKLEKFEEIMHHIMEDYGVKSAYHDGVAGDGNEPPPPPGEGAPPPPGSYPPPATTPPPGYSPGSQYAPPGGTRSPPGTYEAAPPTAPGEYSPTPGGDLLPPAA